MKMKLMRSCVIAALLMMAQGAQAKYLEDKSDTWPMEQDRAFGNVSQVYVDFNTDKTIYCDLPLSSDSNTDGEIVIKKFQNWLLKKMNAESNSIEFLPVDDEISDRDFVAMVYIKEITERGGVDLQVALFRKNNPDSRKYYSVKAKDRKWNDTETLLKENVDKLGEELESDIWWTSHHGARR